MTPDPDSSTAFYSEIFGWKKTENPEKMPSPPQWLFYIKVPDIDDAVARVKELGGKVLNGPEDVPGGGDRVAQCMDPQGAAFAIHSQKGATEG